MDEFKLAEAEAVLGLDIERFLESDLGRYLLGCQAQDEADAKDELLMIDPYKYTSLMELQNTIMRIQEKVLISQKVRNYLEDAIIRGNQAENLIETYEED